MKKNALSWDYCTRKTRFKQILRIMRITTVLLFVTIFFASAEESYSQNARVNISKSNVALSEILDEIENQTDYLFLYNNQVDVNRKLSVKAKQKPVSQVLNNIFDNTDTQFSMEGTHIVLSKKPVGDIAVIEQAGRTVNVMVYDALGEVVGANVVVKGTTIGNITNTEGKVALQNVPENATIVISYVGYITQEINAGNQTSINVELKEDLMAIEEVVVVGYGIQKKVNLTGSISTMDAKELSSRPITQASQALQGKMAGVTVTQNFGMPGSDDATIRIRGIGTLGDNNKLNPLVLIDGIEGSINDINPKDIENISVLKDAASSSIYGSRAANGVVLITTKRGSKEERMSVTVSALTGFQLPTYLPKIVDGVTYMEMKNESVMNMGQAPTFSDAEIETYRRNVGTEPYFNTDWHDAVLKDRAAQYQYDVTVRGGTEKLSGMVSFSNLEQDALIDNTHLDRKTFRFNTDFQATNRLSFAFDGALYTHKNELPSAWLPGIFSSLRETPNIYPVMWADGTYGEGWNGNNPLALIRDGGKRNETHNRVILSIKGKYDFTDWLSAEFRYAPKFISNYVTNMTNRYTYKRIDGTTNVNPTGRLKLDNSYNKTTENFYQAMLRANKTIGDHTFAVVAGFEALDNRYIQFAASRENYLLPDYEVLNNGDANFRDNSGTGNEFALLSYLGRVNYSYKGKYLFEANIRYDGSSRFAKNKRWGTFPSFSAGWRISEEDFMRDIELLSNLKFRASWGRLGNQNIGNYPYLGLISFNTPAKSVPYSFGKTAATAGAQTMLPNENVSWETTQDLTFGLDFGFLNNRLSGSLDIYNRNTFDVLYTRDIPAVLGLNPSEQNIAKVKNIGWDLQLGWQDNAGGLGYSVDFVLSDVRNEVVSLNGKPVYGLNSIFEGEELNAYYGYESLGLYRSQADLDKYPSLSAVTVGDIIFKDQDGDGEIDETNDKTIIGSAIPRYNFGLSINLAYKGFDFNMFLQGVGKKDTYYNVYQSRNGGTWSTYQMDRINPRDESTWATGKQHKLTSGNSNTPLAEINSFHLYNAAYLRCKNISLGYTIPEPITNKIRMSNLRIYLTANNLFTIDKISIDHIDPESPDTNMYASTYYPNLKTLAVGIEVKF